MRGASDKSEIIRVIAFFEEVLAFYSAFIIVDE